MVNKKGNSYELSPFNKKTFTINLFMKTKLNPKKGNVNSIAKKNSTGKKGKFQKLSSQAKLPTTETVSHWSGSTPEEYRKKQRQKINEIFQEMQEQADLEDFIKQKRLPLEMYVNLQRRYASIYTSEETKPVNNIIAIEGNAYEVKPAVHFVALINALN